MLYALLKAAHLLAAMVWLGGMFFALYALRPAAMGLPPAQRVPLMAQALGRFMNAVLVAVLVILLSGTSMWASVQLSARHIGAPFNVPLDWLVMAALGLLMMAIFGHIRWALLRRLQGAVAAQDWPAGADALAAIRMAVGVNLALGVVIVLVTKVGSVG
jgi:uncharacterized membrane protein